jgi:hypothetical protein
MNENEGYNIARFEINRDNEVNLMNLRELEKGEVWR